MTTKFTNPLSSVKIASPCSQDWNEMIGTQRKRFCGECKLNVYNLSGMSRSEAENLLANSEGRLCVRFYKRADGSVLTKDCPVGWQAVKRRVSRISAAAASLVFGLIGGLGLQAAFSETKIGRVLPAFQSTPERLMGAIAPTPKSTPKPKASPTPFIMGEVAIPTPKPTPKKEDAEVLMGKVAAPKNKI